MEEQFAPQEWAVDLRREEFAHSQWVLSRFAGPMRPRGFMLGISLVLAAALFGMLIVDYVEGYPLDWLTLLMGVALLGLTLFFWLAAPVLIKRRAGKQYDRAAACGQTYYGFLRVYGDRVEKVGDTATAVIPLDGTTLFVEDKDTMTFLGNRGWALVLPARCMTQEMATAVRQAADRLPVRNRRFIARLQPKGQPVTPVAAPDAPALWEASLHYTAEEYVAVTREIIRRRYWQMAPGLTVFAVMGGAVTGWDGRSILPCVIWFLVWFGVLTVLNLVLPLSRVKRQAPFLEPYALSLQVRLDRLGAHVTQQHGARAGIPWTDVRHVYDKGDMVEICDKQQSIYIPKRCIEDIDAFDGLITRCREQQNV